MSGPTQEQLAAIEADIDSHVVLTAVPGGGKTYVIEHRIDYLLQHNISPANILVCTFSRSQAEDMQRRIISTLSKKYPYITDSALVHGFGNGVGQITTIHATAKRLLEHYPEYDYAGRSVVPGWKERTILEKWIEQRNWTYRSPRTKKDELIGYQSVLYYINAAKNAAIDMIPAALSEFFSHYLLGRDLTNLVQITLHYERELYKDNLWSFADMLYICEKQLASDEQFRQYWHDRFSYIIIDEAQDTNAQAMRIVRLLNPHSLFIVGDQDQTLYRFNGASPDINLQAGFDEHFGGQRFNMQTNFRSLQNILSRAQSLIEYNYNDKNRHYSKTLRPRDGAELGPDLSYRHYETPEEEAYAVVNEICEDIKTGNREPGDYFVMSRTNAQLAYLELELLQQGIPFVNLGVSSFFNRPVPRKILGYMRLAVNPGDWDAFSEVHNIASRHMTGFRGKDHCATRYLGRKFLERLDKNAPNLIDEAEAHSYDLNAKGWAQWEKGAIDLVETMEVFSEFSMENNAGALTTLIADEVISQWIETEFGVETDASEGAQDDLAVVVSMTKKFTIEQFLKYVDSLQATKDVKPEEMTAFLLIGTVYRFKGLERPVVYIVGASQKIFPHRFSLGSPVPTDGLPIPSVSGIEDERCVMYVGVTRGKVACFISGISHWPTIPEKLQPSQFIKEMGLSWHGQSKQE